MKLGRLYGIGVGPGDPGLLTVRAVSAIRDAQVICAPRAADDAESFALGIVRDYIDPARQRILPVLMPMSMDKTVLERAWADAASVVAAELSAGRDVAFLTLGDPSIYSTYSYILAGVKARLPGVAAETVPGVSSITLAAARAGIDLVKGQERLAVMPLGRDMDFIRRVLDEYDTVVIMKANRNFDKLVVLLEEMRLLQSAVYVSRCGTREEKVIRDLKAIKKNELDYLSLVIVRK